MEIGALLGVAFLAGAVGSGHCLTMCGPVVVLLEQQGFGARGLLRRVAYNAGRMLFYMLLGAVAGGAGSTLLDFAGVDLGLSILRAAATVIVFLLGIQVLADIKFTRYLDKLGAGVWQRLAPLSKHVLPMSTPLRALGAGVVWGALPCGLVYGAASLAATSASATNGALVMASFFAGTVPALLLAGASAHRLAGWSRHASLRRPAGAILCIVAIVALMAPHLHNHGDEHGNPGHSNLTDSADRPAMHVH